MVELGNYRKASEISQPKFQKIFKFLETFNAFGKIQISFRKCNLSRNFLAFEYLRKYFHHMKGLPPSKCKINAEQLWDQIAELPAF